MRNNKTIHLITFGVSILSITLFLFGLYFRTIHYDEPILAEQVLSFQKNGFVQAELFDGMGEGWEIRQYHFHKFFILLGAFVSNIFGFDIYVLRLISFAFFIGLVFLLFRYLKIEKLQSTFLTAILLSVLLTNFTVFEYSFLFRPEIIIAALGFFSFLLLHQFFKTDKIWFAIGSGAVAGLATFTHLNGLSYIMAGGLLLLIFSKWKGAISFSVTAGLFTLLYFFDLNSSSELTAFWDQFRSDPNLSESDFKFFYALMKILNEHLRFFWNVPTGAFSIAYLVCLAYNFSYFKKEHSTLLWYHFILIVCLAAIAQSKTIKYGLVYYPFMVLIISLSLKRVLKPQIFKKQFWIQIGFFTIFLLTNLGAATMFMVKDTTSALIEQNQAYEKYLTKENANVLTTASFYFNSYQKYNIHLILAYELLHEIYLKTPRSKEGFYTFASKQKNDYILLRNLPPNSNMLSLIEFEKLEKGMINFGYKVVYKDKKVVILEKNVM